MKEVPWEVFTTLCYVVSGNHRITRFLDKFWWRNLKWKGRNNLLSIQPSPVQIWTPDPDCAENLNNLRKFWCLILNELIINGVSQRLKKLQIKNFLKGQWWTNFRQQHLSLWKLNGEILVNVILWNPWNERYYLWIPLGMKQATTSLKMASQEKIYLFYECSPLLGFIMSKKQERLRSELSSEDKITNLLGFLT